MSLFFVHKSGGPNSYDVTCVRVNVGGGIVRFPDPWKYERQGQTLFVNRREIIVHGGTFPR